MEKICKNQPAFSAMTVNIRFGLADDGPNNWIYRKNRFASLFQTHKVDFIAMQEVNNFQKDYFQEILQDYNFMGKRAPAPSDWQDNIIFYKNSWKCIHEEHFFLSNTPSVPSSLPKSIWPRQCVIGIFKNNDRTIILINTHFDFEASVQLKSAQIIIEKLSHLPRDIPVLLMGDFNTEPGSPCYNEFTTKNKWGIILKDIFPGKFSCTHHAFTGTCKGGHIDWLLYCGNINLKNRKIIKDKFKGAYPSDHFPVWALFEWS